MIGLFEGSLPPGLGVKYLSGLYMGTGHYRWGVFPPRAWDKDRWQSFPRRVYPPRDRAPGPCPLPESFSLLYFQSYIEFTWARPKIRENYYHRHCISIYLRLFSRQMKKGYFKRVVRLSSKSWYSGSLRDTSRNTHLKWLKMFEFEKT